MVINTNITSQIVHNISRINNNNLSTHFERLSSGLRINKGADNPSGLAISSGMKAQIRGINVALQNVQDGISVLQLQDGALAETHDMLLRMRDLTVRGANEATLTDEDRGRMQIELDQLALEITRKSVATTYNTKKVMVGEDVPGGYDISYLAATDGHNGDIYKIHADGTGNVRLTALGAIENRSEISPDGSKILFCTVRDGNKEIYVMDKDGSNQINLTNNASFDGFPTWSPDGEKILFTSLRSGNADLYIMNSDGSNVRQLTNDPSTDFRCDWAPDGSKAIFSSDRSGNYELYAIDIDGTGITQLTNTGAMEANSFWSPDGKKIQFDRPGSGIFVMNQDGTNIVNLLPQGLVNSWTLQEDKIIFQAGQVMQINQDGTNLINLTGGPNVNVEGWEGSPGPDGQSLQIGPDNNSSERLTITYRDCRASALGVAGVSVMRQKAAYCGIELCNHGIEVVSNYRSEIGQAQRRLEKVANDLTAQNINISAANSRIVDADFADEATGMTKEMIKQQSTTAMTSNANNIYSSAQKLVGIIHNSERVDKFNQAFYA